MCEYICEHIFSFFFIHNYFSELKINKTFLKSSKFQNSLFNNYMTKQNQFFKK